MRTIETVLYNFDELPETAKQTAIEKHYESEGYFCLADDILDYISNNDTFFSDIDLQYSLSYSQGDGLSFSAKFDLLKWLKEKEGLSGFKLDAVYNICEITVEGNKGRYSYSSRNDVDIDFLCSKDYFNIEDFCAEILERVQDYYIDLCREAEKYGYGVLEYRMDESEFSDFCDANGYEFDVNGNLQ